MTKTITRVAIPAHIYITVETPDTYSDEQIIAEAIARVREAETSREYLTLPAFDHDEHALVYPDYEGKPSIEERAW